MARKPKSYFEPWSATRSRSWEKAFRYGPIMVPSPADPECKQAVLDFEAKRAKAENDAEWIVFGSGMADPVVSVSLSGEAAVFDDRRILTFTRTLGLPDASISHRELAQRAAVCVNGCEGIIDPVKFMADVRVLLLEYARGEGGDPREDNRVISLLSRCIPPEELQEINLSHVEI